MNPNLRADLSRLRQFPRNNGSHPDRIDLSTVGPRSVRGLLHRANLNGCVERVRLMIASGLIWRNMESALATLSLPEQARNKVP